MGRSVVPERPDLSGDVAGLWQGASGLDPAEAPRPVPFQVPAPGHARQTPRQAPGQALGQGPVQAQCGALPFLIQRDGTWLYRGSPIRRKPLVCLFASVLRRDETGTFWLETPAERGSIEVEDAPFVAVELDWRGCGRDQVLAFRTNVDQIVCAGPEHGLLVDWRRPCHEDGGGAVPYLQVRGEGRQAIQARVARAVYYELAALAVRGQSQGQDCLGVWSQNMFFPIGRLPPEED